MTVDCYEFLQIVNEQELDETATHLITVSDGSGNDGSMSFGWIARCSGPAFGPSGSSFCAKGYGFLSVTRFLVRLCKFCAVTPTWSVKMLTDNQG
jgi:hypothetical protein